MFSKATFDFLAELAANNERAWFEANKARYEALVRAPALDFIAAMAPQLEKFAPNFRAEPKKMGGSLMRVFRDTRFSRDKTPYKTNIGIQFRHALGKDVHAPGYYVHIATEECFFGVGCWHPEPDALVRIRERIASKPDAWFAVRDDRKFAAQFELVGDSLKRVPQGYTAEHVAADDLRRKDYIGLAPLAADEVIGAGLVKLAGSRFAAATPFMKFLCDAMDLKL